jgi:hypothetical protein
MAESTSNVEFAHRIHEQGHHGGPHGRAEWLEVIEAVVLAAVAVLTAWSGYQAAKWDARSASAYALSSQLNAQSQEQKTLAGQDHLYDVLALMSWVQATRGGDREYAAMLERRFRPEYSVAFQAWVKTDPFHNANAPLGPAFMPEYKSARVEKSRELEQKARESYERGISSRETGDEYVRITVVLATVLLLTALSQRFRIHAARVGLVAIASIMLVVAIWWIATFPRA